MLRTIIVGERFRTIDPDLFASGVGCGKRTVIFGHNGSGKSSLADILHGVSGERLEQSVVWEDENSNRHSVPAGGRAPHAELSVFTRSWIRENVAAMLDGSTAAAIVVLGEDAIAAQSRANEVAAQLTESRSELLALESKERDAQRLMKAEIEYVQDDIDSKLRPIDYTRYTKNRYNEPRVARMLRSSGPVADPGDSVEELIIRATADPLDALPTERSLDVDWMGLHDRVASLLSRTLTSRVITSLVGDSVLQRWIADGLSLHDGHNSCLFCGGPLLDSRLAALRGHFDESRAMAQREARDLITEIEGLWHQVESWANDWPDVSNLEPELVEQARLLAADHAQWGEVATDYLAVVADRLDAKFDDPNVSVNLDLEPMETPSFESDAVNLVRRHNELVASASTRRAECCEEILSRLVNARRDDYVAHWADQLEFAARVREASAVIDAQAREVERLRSLQFSTSEMAERLSEDMSYVFGKHHLQIRVDAEGQAYRCFRDEGPAFDLSDGERNILALLYFIRRLEDASRRVDPSSHVVVIDDPSSSLDREAIYATHSWLLDCLNVYAQVVIMTHDFELLRLLIGSQANQVSRSRRVVKAVAHDPSAAADEARFPRIAFLELRAIRTATGERRSRMRPLSPSLLDHPSEYHFLFDRVMDGIENPDDHDQLLLLPNAARRMLESFSSFHAPQFPNFESRLRKIAIEDLNERYRDVYDFCNRHSHGEGRDLLESLDAPAVAHQLRRCMELLHAVDARHFESMCAATHHAVNTIVPSMSPPIDE